MDGREENSPRLGGCGRFDWTTSQRSARQDSGDASGSIDDDGLIAWGNLIIATGHNNLALSRGVFQVAKHFVNGAKLSEGMLNRVEVVVRAFDPCLSCSTHALGHMALQVQLMAADGTIVDENRQN
jgi:NAD-reducing hydrogenase large subunit